MGCLLSWYFVSGPSSGASQCVFLGRECTTNSFLRTKYRNNALPNYQRFRRQGRFSPSSQISISFSSLSICCQCWNCRGDARSLLLASSWLGYCESWNPRWVWPCLGMIVGLTFNHPKCSACLAGVANLTIRFARYLPKHNRDYTWNVIDTYIAKWETPYYDKPPRLLSMSSFFCCQGIPYTRLTRSPDLRKPILGWYVPACQWWHPLSLDGCNASAHFSAPSSGRETRASRGLKAAKTSRSRYVTVHKVEGVRLFRGRHSSACPRGYGGHMATEKEMKNP